MEEPFAGGASCLALDNGRNSTTRCRLSELGHTSACLFRAKRTEMRLQPSRVNQLGSVLQEGAAGLAVDCDCRDVLISGAGEDGAESCAAYVGS